MRTHAQTSESPRVTHAPQRKVGRRWPILAVIGFASALVAFVLFFGLAGPVPGLGDRGPASAEADQPVFLAPPPAIDPADIDTLLPPDGIRAIDDPQFETAEAAAASLDPGERVIGVVINGEARAYPLPIMSNHEIVNDVVGGQPVAVTWCPLCYTALAFSRRLRGRQSR